MKNKIIYLVIILVFTSLSCGYNLSLNVNNPIWDSFGESQESDSNYQSLSGWAFDGLHPDFPWVSSFDTVTHWVFTTWVADVYVSKIVVKPSLENTWTMQEFEIQILASGGDKYNESDWIRVDRVLNFGVGTTEEPYLNDGIYIFTPSVPIKTKGVRLYIVHPSQASQEGSFDLPNEKMARLSEMEIYGFVEHTISHAGSNRATGYSMSNKIVSVGTGSSRRTYVAWLDNSDPQTDETSIKIKEFNTNTNEWGSLITLGTGVDNHAGPSLVVDGIGRLHCVYGSHNSSFKYRYTPNPSDLTSWSTEEIFSGGTYPSLVSDLSDPNVLHMTCREQENYPSKLIYYKRELHNGNYTWRSKLALVDSNLSQQWYTNYGNSLTIDSNGTLHLAYHILYEERDQNDQVIGEKSQVAGYMKSQDGGVTWKKADGSIISLPATPTNGDIIVFDENSHFEVGNIATDKSNNPWLIIGDRSTESSYVYHNDGYVWKKYNIMQMIRNKFPDAYTDVDAVLSLTINDEVWIAMSFYEGVGGWGSPDCEILLFGIRISDLKNNNYSYASLLQLSETDDATANWLPSIERSVGNNFVDKPFVMYTHGNWSESLAQVRVVDGSNFNVLYSSCSQVIAGNYGLKGDFNSDCYVDFQDFAIFAMNWMSCVKPSDESCSKPWK